MRKIAILYFKGGTGKTTTAVNLGHALSLKKYKVLTIDCDPQASIHVSKEHGCTNFIKDKLLFSTLGAFLFTISNLLYS